MSRFYAGTVRAWLVVGVSKLALSGHCKLTAREPNTDLQVQRPISKKLGVPGELLMFHADVVLMPSYYYYYYYYYYYCYYYYDYYYYYYLSCCCLTVGYSADGDARS